MAIRLGTEDKKKRWIAMISVSLALTWFAHTLWQLEDRAIIVAPGSN